MSFRKNATKKTRGKKGGYISKSRKTQIVRFSPNKSRTRKSPKTKTASILRASHKTVKDE